MKPKAILAIETSGSRFSLALLKEKQPISVMRSTEDMVHESKLAISVQEMLMQNNTAIQELSCIAAGTGPGSYSGLRIGMALASGISLAADIPLIAVGTLENIAFQLRERNPDMDYYAALLPARKDECFFGIWENHLEQAWLAPAWMLNTEAAAMARELKPFSRLACNESAGFLSDTFPGLIHVPEVQADASAVAKIAFNRIKSGITFPNAAEPDYLKPVYISSPK